MIHCMVCLVSLFFFFYCGMLSMVNKGLLDPRQGMEGAAVSKLLQHLQQYSVIYLKRMYRKNAANFHLLLQWFTVD